MRAETQGQFKTLESNGERNPKLLLGWKQIANYLGMGVRTVQRHERLNALPIRRPAGHPKSAVFATVVELDAWVAASPIRVSLKLGRQPSADVVMASLQKSMAKMGALRDELQRLTNGLRDSVNLLRSSIRVVGVMADENQSFTEGDDIDSERKPECNRVLNLLHLDVKDRKPV